MFVTKRNGNKELLDLNKFHDMVSEACKDLTGVSASEVEMNSKIQFYDGISTKDIQTILIKSASDLISLDAPNYQYVAARLLLSGLRKDVFGQFEPKSLLEMVNENITRGFYEPKLLEWYTENEFNEMEKKINHNKDFKFSFCGLQQLIDKYLIQTRLSGQVYEVPQHMYMLVAATLFHAYPKETRMKYVIDYYNALSDFKINIPTPILAGARTKSKQLSSCILVDVDDSLKSIFNSNTAIGEYIARKAGIGLNIGRLRGLNSPIRNGESYHTGIIPFIKVFASTVMSCSQGNLRKGSANFFYPIWHQEVEDLIVLKNNKGTEENRVRTVDYCVQLSKIFYERYINNEDITLFSPHDVPDLYDNFGLEKFDELYVKYEKNKKIKSKKINARTLINTIMQERADTGRIYIMNMDNANSHSSFIEELAPIKISNLCTEIDLPTKPISSVDDPNGEIANCILSGINLGLIDYNNLGEMESICNLIVRALDEVIDYQEYPIIASENSAKRRRTIGVGYIGLAHYLAKNYVKYDEQEAWDIVNRTTEAFQYYLIKASVELAKEKGPCEYFNQTKYSKGILPIDTYKKDVNSIVSADLLLDWESLRRDILTYGMRHSTLSCMFPSESSSVVVNETNGIEPPRGYLSVKKSKKGPIKQIVPEYKRLKKYYTLLWDMKDNTGNLNIAAVIQKYIDQGISFNTNYNPEYYKDNQIPLSVMIKDMLNFYKFGGKQMYYHNTNDLMKDQDFDNKPNIIENETNKSANDDTECESCVV